MLFLNIAGDENLGVLCELLLNDAVHATRSRVLELTPYPKNFASPKSTKIQKLSMSKRTFEAGKLLPILLKRMLLFICKLVVFLCHMSLVFGISIIVAHQALIIHRNQVCAGSH